MTNEGVWHSIFCTGSSVSGSTPESSPLGVLPRRLLAQPVSAALVVALRSVVALIARWLLLVVAFVALACLSSALELVSAVAVVTCVLVPVPAELLLLLIAVLLLSLS